MKTLLLTLTMLLSVSAFAEGEKCVAMLQDASEIKSDVDLTAVKEAALLRGYKVVEYKTPDQETGESYTLIRYNTKLMPWPNKAKSETVKEPKKAWSTVEVSSLAFSKSAMVDYFGKGPKRSQAMLVAAVNQTLPKCKN